MSSIDVSSVHREPIIQRDLAELYNRRAARLRALAEGHEQADYLLLAARIAEKQAQLSMPVPTQSSVELLDAEEVAGSEQWLVHLDALISMFQEESSAEFAEALALLNTMSSEEKIDTALQLLRWEFSEVPAVIAPLLWSALSLEVSLVARRTQLVVPEQESSHCPVCGGLPVASTILTGKQQGLRYLHCTLCESDWHMVRSKCSSCNDSKQVEYLSLDSEEAAVRAESCNHCMGYLKVISEEREQEVEVVADDLATLLLDMAVVEEGFGRTGFNPFALPVAAEELPEV
ncbi:MAG: formate dehydrogenase accessory protein FdhE [Alcaligenaceae bacterium]|nr:formate dehydrogenase accessory protein FdhE [Alcaligenaceae bacterium]